MDSISTWNLLGHRPLGIESRYQYTTSRRGSEPFRFLLTKFTYGKELCPLKPFKTVKGLDDVSVCSVKALAMELTKETRWFRENYKMPGGLSSGSIGLKQVTWPSYNKADNPLLHNPLLRQERMGCGWLGAIFEWEGVIVEDDPYSEKRAWLSLSQEEGKSPPPTFILKRIEGMKNEQAISEVLCWSRDPNEIRRLSMRKEDIYQSHHGTIHQMRPGSQEFVNTLINYQIPIALVSTRPRKNLLTAIQSVGVEGYFNVIVAAEDVHRAKPDPEMFLYASQLLNFIPERCIVFGNSNCTVEAAHDAMMKCVAVASKHPIYELGAADLVVRHLDELSIIDLKNLADIEMTEFGYPEAELEMEEEEVRPSTSMACQDPFWSHPCIHPFHSVHI